MSNEKMKLIAMRAMNRAEPSMAAGDHEQSQVGAAIRAATPHADLRSTVSTGSLQTFKRAVSRAIRPFLTRQTAYNAEILQAISQLNHVVHLVRSELAGVHSQLDQVRRLHAAERALIEMRVDEVQGRVTALDAAIAALPGRLETALAEVRTEVANAIAESRRAHEAERTELETTVAPVVRELSDARTGQRQLAGHVRILHDDVQRLVTDLRRTGQHPSTDTLNEVRGDDPMFEALYERFEEAFRGSTPEIEKRLEVYLPDVESLAGDGPPLLDLGSGRGEWLQLLRRVGVPAAGVDISRRFVEQAVANGLDLREADALGALAEIEPASLGGVSAFQLVEHLEPPHVQRLLDLAFRALVPGGVLILETPNPTNLRVGAGSFYRDPTHLRPVHPDLLTFMVSETGFVGVETRFVNPMLEFGDPFDTTEAFGSAEVQRHRDLVWALYGPQDYAVVARRPRETAG
jgi:O-antigen chain-terminating methyltransferase